jgi:hypothetical protein
MKDSSQEYEQRLEKLIDSELKKLPRLAAPPTLLPDVLKEIKARAERPWWRKSFLGWPRGAQLAFLLSAVFLCAASIYSAQLAGSWIGSHPLVPQVSRLATFCWENLALAFSTAGALANSLGVWSWVALGATGCFMYASCLGLGFAFFKVISPGSTSPSAS